MKIRLFKNHNVIIFIVCIFFLQPNPIKASVNQKALSKNYLITIPKELFVRMVSSQQDDCNKRKVYSCLRQLNKKIKTHVDTAHFSDKLLKELLTTTKQTPFLSMYLQLHNPGPVPREIITKKLHQIPHTDFDPNNYLGPYQTVLTYCLENKCDNLVSILLKDPEIDLLKKPHASTDYPLCIAQHTNKEHFKRMMSLLEQRLETIDDKKLVTFMHHVQKKLEKMDGNIKQETLLALSGHLLPMWLFNFMFLYYGKSIPYFPLTTCSMIEIGRNTLNFFIGKKFGQTLYEYTYSLKLKKIKELTSAKEHSLSKREQFEIIKRSFEQISHFNDSKRKLPRFMGIMFLLDICITCASLSSCNSCSTLAPNAYAGTALLKSMMLGFSWFIMTLFYLDAFDQQHYV